MRTKIVKVHYCDFCRKRKFTIPAMQKHEASCTLNPNRVCKMCVMAGHEQRPIEELAAAFNSAGKPDSEWEEKEKVLRAACENCPACLLATARQTTSVVVNLDFKSECKAWLNEFTRYENYESL